jgi:hypothetical protein
MTKRVCVYSLPEGVDGDAFWKYHTEVHAKDVIRLAGPALKKYIINGVVKVINGKQQFFELIERWWESEEAMNRALRESKLPDGRTVANDFWSRATNGFVCLVEEYIAKE